MTARTDRIRALAHACALASCVLLSACVDVREGVFACGDDSECPSGWSCRVPEARCYRTAQGPSIDAGDDVDASDEEDDAGAADDASVVSPDAGHATADASIDDAGDPDVDSGSSVVDAGPIVVDAGADGGIVLPDAGRCGGAGVCEPGTTEVETLPCTGGCGTIGSQTRTRTCDASCLWGAWSAFGGCTGCAPTTEVDSEPCGMCGTWSRSRACETTTCTWGAWTGFGACTGEGVCQPGETDMQACGTTVTCGGTRGVQERFCTDGCGWTGWGTCNCF